MQLAALETSWGISAEAEERFSILEELSVPGATRWFAARERSSGARCWLEAPSDGGSHSELGSIAAKLYGLRHPHILQPVEVDRLFIAYEWRAEEPLCPRRTAQLPLPVRVRIAYQLVSALEYLHNLPVPHAHGSLHLSRLWITPGTQWLKLAAFSPESTSPALLAKDATDALTLVEELVTGPRVPLEHLDALNRLREEAEEAGQKPWAGLRATLAGMHLDLVSGDI